MCEYEGKFSVTTKHRPIARAPFLRFFALCVLSFGVMLSSMSAARAACCGCSSGDCSQSGQFIDQAHRDIRDTTNNAFSNGMEAYEDWLTGDFLGDEVVVALADMLSQMNAVAMQYTQIVGAFLDAKTQMETQRTFEKLKFDAHKDYIPSEDFCWFGTNARSLAASQSRAAANSVAMSRMSIARQVGARGSAGASAPDADLRARWAQFVRTYCNVRDNNFIRNTPSGDVLGTGLSLACDHDGPGGSTNAGATEPERVNRDLDYTRLIDEPRTLDVNFTDAEIANSTDDEEDVIAMERNLYGHRVLSRALSGNAVFSEAGQALYMGLRSIAAMRSVAGHSFNAIVSLKTAGTSTDRSAPEYGYETQRYMAAVMRELMSPGASGLGEYIFGLIGTSPSYYAQLEILAKRIYQNPDFYASLYDTPANVARKKVAMQAIELMIDREIYESQLRREMTVSVLLSGKLKPEHRAVNAALGVARGH